MHLPDDGRGRVRARPGRFVAFDSVASNLVSGDVLYTLDTFVHDRTATAFNYTLSNSGNITVTKGGAGSNTITATLTSGFSQGVSFSASELPIGAAASFNLGACNPTCSSQLMISTTWSTPTGTFRIKVTGSPLSKTTLFDLVVNSICPATAALEGTPDREAGLGLLYAFRDKVLAATPTGRRYIGVFYKHAAEGVWLMFRHSELRASSRMQLDRFFPILRALLAGRRASLTRTDLAAIDSLLEAFAATASAGLQADLRAMQYDLRQPRALRQLGIDIQDR